MDVKITDLPAFDLDDDVIIKSGNDVTTFSRDVITTSKYVISVLRDVSTRADDQLTAADQRIVTSDYIYDAPLLDSSHVSTSSSSIVIHFSVVAALFAVVLLLTFVNLWLKKFHKGYDGRCGGRSSTSGRDDSRPSSRARRKSWNERISGKGNDVCSVTRKTTLKMNANVASFV